jgi:hypothetical protein
MRACSRCMQSSRTWPDSGLPRGHPRQLLSHRGTLHCRVCWTGWPRSPSLHPVRPNPAGSRHFASLLTNEKPYWATNPSGSAGRRARKRYRTRRRQQLPPCIGVFPGAQSEEGAGYVPSNSVLGASPLRTAIRSRTSYCEPIDNSMQSSVAIVSNLPHRDHSRLHTRPHIDAAFSDTSTRSATM